MTIPKVFLDILIEYAKDSREVCGFLSGKNDRVFSLYVITNMAKSRDRFRMAEEEVVSALHLMESEGEDLLAIWHSHPGGRAEPSLVDIREHSFPEAIAIIVSGSSIAGFSLKNEKILEINLDWGGIDCE